MKRKKSLSITIDQDVLEAIRIAAKADERSVSGMINWILRDYVMNDVEDISSEKVTESQRH